MITDITSPPMTTDPHRTVVAVAWPTGRPVYAYTVAELTDGVDLYTRSLKARLNTDVKAGAADAR